MLDNPIYANDLAVQRVKAAVTAARSLPFPFATTARAENLINGPCRIRSGASPCLPKRGLMFFTRPA